MAAERTAVALADGTSRVLVIGGEYEFTFRRPSDSRRDYVARLGLAGQDGRGRLRFEGSPRTAVQVIDPRWITVITDVPCDRAARHVTPVPRAGAAHQRARAAQALTAAGPGTVLTFTVVTGLPRLEALDRRDEILDALAALGLRVSLIDCGTDIRMADRGVATLGDVLTGQDPQKPAPGVRFTASERVAAGQAVEVHPTSQGLMVRPLRPGGKPSGTAAGDAAAGEQVVVLGPLGGGGLWGGGRGGARGSCPPGWASRSAPPRCRNWPGRG